MNPGKDCGILVLCVEKCIFAQVSCVRKCSCMDRKLSIRFYKDREVRAVWDGEHNKWWFSVLDIIGVLNEQDDYSKNRNYWKYLKTKLKKENNELVSATNQLKLQAPDGKLRLTDVLDNEGIMLLARNFPNNKAADFLDWSLIDKNDYLAAMTQSVVDSCRIKQLISNALTDKIEDREVFMKGIDYSYYYEQVDE